MNVVAKIVYASLLIGVPLIYIIWNAFKQRQYLRVFGIAVGLLLLLLFPTPTLPLLWGMLFGLMAICLTIFTIFSCLSVYLLFVARRVPDTLDVGTAPKIAVLIPAKDEARVIAGCLDSILCSSYPADRLEIIVIDDASSDGTAEIAAAYQDRYPNIRLVVRSPSATQGKAAALNELIMQIEDEFICILDADHQVAKTFFSRTLADFRDPQIGGVQVRITARNWSDNLLTRLVDLELLGWQYSFLDSKSHANLVPVSFGSGCIFRTKLLQHLGGFNNDLATEDVELSFCMYEAGYKIKFEPATYTTDELVSDLRSFFRQRYRWARGTTQAVRRHWFSFYQIGRATRREKLDFFFYPILLYMMIVPYLQVFTHALAMITKKDLPLIYLTPLSYVFVTIFSYVVAGLRNQKEGDGIGPSGFFKLLLLSIGMCFYYGLLFLPANTKAFIDEFVLGIPYHPMKTKHRGPRRVLQQDWLSGKILSQSTAENRILLTFGRHAPERLLFPPHSALHKVDWKRLEQLALFHGVAGHIHVNLVQHGFDALILPHVRNNLLGFRRKVLARNLFLQHAWNQIAQAFGRAEIETIPLKGIYFIDHFYQLDVRPIHDIDLLVKPLRVEAASRLLGSLGYEEITNSLLFRKAWRTQRAFRNPITEVSVDLHWDLINMSAYNEIYTLTISDLWQRAHPSADNAYIYEMAPEDLLLQNALHSAIHHGYMSLSQLVDLGEIVRSHNLVLDWVRVSELAAKYRIKNPIYFALMLIRELLDIPVPDTALKVLQPPFYRRLCFHWYLLGQRRSLDKQISMSGNQLRWGKELKWPGLTSIILADSFVDSLRVAWATLIFFLMNVRLFS
jgi:cellulose synthase/poly-beta-1,6-N-acetylglucosamine synthase-like glycosyltransferase